jgi:hypothetical protein
MALIKVNANPSRSDLRLFAGVWFPLFFFVAGLQTWRKRRKTGSLQSAIVIWAIAGVISLIALAWQGAGRLLYVGLMYLTLPIGWVMSHAILAVMYYGVMTPIGLLLRLFGHDSMRRTFDRSASSYWLPRRETESPDRYFRQF